MNMEEEKSVDELITEAEELVKSLRVDLDLLKKQKLEKTQKQEERNPMYKIIVKGEAQSDFPYLGELDGIDCQDEFSENFDSANKFGKGQQQLIDKGVCNGYMRFEYDNNKLWTITEYESEQELTDEELEILKDYTVGQWSDGIGEGFEQHPCYMTEDSQGEEVEVFIAPWHMGQEVTIIQEKMNKFEGYTKEEKRKVVFEFFRQKYLKNPNLFNFGSYIKLMNEIITNYVSDEDCTTKLIDLKNTIKKETMELIANEVMYYFYFITEDETLYQKYPNFKRIHEIIGTMVDIKTFEAINDFPTEFVTYEPFGDQKGSMVLMSGKTFVPEIQKQREEAERDEEERLYREKYPNPYGTDGYKDGENYWYGKPKFKYESICDILRYNFFEYILHERANSLGYIERMYDLVSIIPSRSEVVKNYPQHTDEDGNKDDLDFENFDDFAIINENAIGFNAGGDWQEPQDVTMRVNKKGKIVANPKYKKLGKSFGYRGNDICHLFGLDEKNYDFINDSETEFYRFYQDCVKNKDYKIK